VLDSYDGGSFQIGGTSLATAALGGLIASPIRAARSTVKTPWTVRVRPCRCSTLCRRPTFMTSPRRQRLSRDGRLRLATGLGTPIANLLVPALAGFSGTDVWTGLQSILFNPNNGHVFSSQQHHQCHHQFRQSTAATAIDIAASPSTAVCCNRRRQRGINFTSYPYRDGNNQSHQQSSLHRFWNCADPISQITAISRRATTAAHGPAPALTALLPR